MQGCVWTEWCSPHTVFLRKSLPELTGVPSTARVPLHTLLRRKWGQVTQKHHYLKAVCLCTTEHHILSCTAYDSLTSTLFYSSCWQFCQRKKIKPMICPELLIIIKLHIFIFFRTKVFYCISHHHSNLGIKCIHWTMMQTWLQYLCSLQRSIWTHESLEKHYCWWWNSSIFWNKLFS